MVNCHSQCLILHYYYNFLSSLEYNVIIEKGRYFHADSNAVTCAEKHVNSFFFSYTYDLLGKIFALIFCNISFFFIILYFPHDTFLFYSMEKGTMNNLTKDISSF